MEAGQAKAAAGIYEDAVRKKKRDELVLNHLEYVRQICGTLAKRLPAWVDLQNLQSAGVVGLIEAAQNYEESRGVAFKTFSYPRIRGAIVDEIRRNSPLSQKVMNQVTQIWAAIETIEPPATTELIARKTGLTITEVEEGLAAARVISPQSLDDQGHPGLDGETPESQLENQERIRLLADAIEQLPERDRLVVTMYYLEELRLKEIGVILGVSESRVSRILTRAELALRESVRRKEGN
jgi:RNA polymerase sigma factor for flagellar operon FliA